MKTLKAYTFIEVILYIGLTSTFITAAIIFGWNIVFAKTKSIVIMDVNYNARLASKRIEYELRNASAINSLTANSICIASTDATRNPTRIYTSGGQLRIGWGGGSPTCASLTNDFAMTGSNLNVSALSFTRRTSGLSANNISYSITLQSTASRTEWQYSQTYSGSVEIRVN